MRPDPTYVGDGLPPTAIERSDELAHVISENGPTKTIQIVPIELGPIDVMVQVIYADDGIVRKWTRINVVPSSTGLQKFELMQGDTMVLSIRAGTHLQQQWLRPSLQYASRKYPIYLRSSDGIELAIQQDKDNPVITVSREGQVKALRKGDAIITGTFAGVTSKVKVVVSDNF